MRWAWIPAIAFAVVGCRWFNDDEGLIRNTADDYLEARVSEPLIVPQDMEDERVQDAWPIPVIVEKPLAKHYPTGAPRLDAIVRSNDAGAVKIQKLGGRSWLIVSNEPFSVWPVVKQFLADNGVEVSFEAPAQGLIGGVWLLIEEESYRDVIRVAIQDGKKENGISGGKDRIRFKIEQGIRDGSSEVHVRHENDSSVGEMSKWPDSSALTSVETVLLTEIGSYYAAGLASPAVSKAALGISTDMKATIESDAQGYPQLRLNLDFDRAWAAVSQALGRANIEIERSERDKGLFQVAIERGAMTGDKSEPFLARLWSRGDDAKSHAVDIRIASVDSGAHLVRVLEREGGPAPQYVGRQILALLREFSS